MNKFTNALVKEITSSGKSYLWSEDKFPANYLRKDTPSRERLFYYLDGFDFNKKEHGYHWYDYAPHFYVDRWDKMSYSEKLMAFYHGLDRADEAEDRACENAGASW